MRYVAWLRAAALGGWMAWVAVGFASASESAAPTGLRPLDERRQEELSALLAEAESVRGLSRGDEILIGRQSADHFESYLTGLLDEELPEEVVAAAERILRRFGLIPETLDLRSFYVDLLSSQVAGYFDPETGALVLVDLADTAAAAPHAETMEALQDAVLLHEIVHYLQDVHFDLATLMEGDPFGDGSIARQALIEGDATRAMFQYLFGFEIDRHPMMRGLFGAVFSDEEMMREMASGFPGGEQLFEAPTYFRESLLFPYFQGMVFAMDLRQLGGEKLLNHAFRVDPPRSTEQVLHPEKWMTERDDPVEFDAGAVASAAVDGRPLVRQGSWGEFGVSLVLREHGVDRETAEVAAAGWGGDRYALYGEPGSEILLWATEWDSGVDATEFASTVAALDGWRSAGEGTRHVLASADASVPEAAVAELVDRFLSLPTHRTASIAPDLDALGVRAEDLPGKMSPDEMMAVAESPRMRELFGAEPIDEELAEDLFADPAMRGEIEGMLSDPEFQEQIRAAQQIALANAPEIVVSEGRIEIPEIGVEVVLPTGEGWVESADPMTGGPKFAHAEGGAFGVAVVPLPPGSPISAVAVGLEFQLGQQGFEKEESESSPYQGYPSYRAVFTNEGLGVHLRFVQVREHGVVVTTGSPAGLSDRVAEALRESFESLTIVESEP